MTPVPFQIHWYSIGLVAYRARRAVHAVIFLKQSIVQPLRLRVRLLITAKIVLIS